MEKFTQIDSVAAPLPEGDIDTDILFPARFLLLPDKTGLGKHLFHERRHRHDKDAPPFILNTSPFDKAEILVAGPNFGCGSSREQAVWALMDFGIRCVIAPSFGEIFYANCFKNGALPIVLDEDQHRAALAAAATGRSLSVRLEEQTIRLPGGDVVAFAVDPYRRRCLLTGLDEIGAIIADDSDDIAAFERRQRAHSPWAFLDAAQLSFFADLNKDERDE
jgi:3-isopropylmalate/(R)-2-methylmalate dehydratase small subunit